MPLVEMKDFNTLVDNNPLFDQTVKNKQESYEKLVEMSRNGDYSTVNLLNYLYYQNYYKLIGIDYQDKQIQVFLSKLISQEN